MRPIVLAVRQLRDHAVAVCRVVLVEYRFRRYSIDVAAADLGAPLRLDRTQSVPPNETTGADLTRSQRSRTAAIHRVLRIWPFEDTCLRRSLACGHALRSLKPALRIGVALDEGGEVLAHSWLEFDGFSLGLNDEVQYRALRSSR